MAKFCQNCGKSLDDNAQFCDGCGQTQNTAQAAGGAPSEQQASQATGGNVYTAEDIEKNKVMAGLAYFLFFLPLVACPESAFGRYHANQGLLLLIVGIGGSIILGIIPILGWILLPFFYIAVTIFAILGLVNGLKGIVKPLPLIGKFQIIK